MYINMYTHTIVVCRYNTVYIYIPIDLHNIAAVSGKAWKATLLAGGIRGINKRVKLASG